MSRTPPIAPILIALAVLCIEGCSEAEDPPVSQRVQLDLSCPTRIYANGEMVAQVDPLEESRIEYGYGDELTAECLTPDGWQKVECFADALHFLIRVTKNLQGQKEVDGFTLLCDNRGGTVATLSIGAWSVRVPADGKIRLELPRGATPETRQLRLDGRLLGSTEKWTYLVDTTGRRHYRWRKIFYGGPSSIGSEPAMPEPEHYRAAFLHEIQQTSCFLEAPPASIPAYDPGDTSKLTVLEEVVD